MSSESPQSEAHAENLARIRSALGNRCLVFIGLMGAGKTSIGRRMADQLGLPFIDADEEIQKAANLSISDIFENHGEEEFRRGERQVIARILTQGPLVLSTGGGAFMDPDTQEQITERGISIWLRAKLDLLMMRVRRRSNRPLLQKPDPEKIMQELMDLRYPVYAKADFTIESRDQRHEETIAQIVELLSDTARNNTLFKS